MERTLVLLAVKQLKDTAWYLERTCDASYSQPLPRLGGQHIGELTRHIVGNYQALSKAMRACMSEEQMVLSYDPAHCYRAIGLSPGVALAAVEDLCEKMPRYAGHGFIWVKMTALRGEQPLLLPSSIERELLVNLERTQHLLGLVKEGLRLLSPCLQLPALFGETLPEPQPIVEPVHMYPTFLLAEPEQFRIAV